MRSFWYDNPGHLIYPRHYFSLPNLGDHAWDRGPWIDYPGRSLSLSFNIGFWSPLIGSLVESIECSVNTRADYARLSRPTVLPTEPGFFFTGHLSCRWARFNDTSIHGTNYECRRKKIQRYDSITIESTTNRIITLSRYSGNTVDAKTTFFFFFF